MNGLDRQEFQKYLGEAKIKPRLQRELRFVPEEITDWESRDFLAVMNRSRSEGVIVAPLIQTHIVPFSLQKRTANQAGRVEAILCDICATWRRGTESAIITFKKERSSISFLCCEDLLCSLHVRDKTAASKLSRAQLREDTSIEARVERLRQRLNRILEKVNRGPG